MAYQLQERESLSEGIKRIAEEQIDKALDYLSNQTSRTHDKAIHNSRKRFKQLRALLRLVRHQIGEDIYKRENRCFRDAGRLLADVRDAQVRLETLEKLTADFGDSISPEGFGDVRKGLMAQRRSVSKAVRNSNNSDDVIALLQAARERVQEWPLADNSWSALSYDFQRVYKRGYKGLDHAFADDVSVGNLHEWRKAVKDHWYQLRILKGIWPGLMKQIGAEVGELADYLGDEHDLAMLAQLLIEQPELGEKSSEVQALMALIDRRRVQLQLCGKSLGQRVYAERPRVFVSRIETYWQVWQSEIKQPALAELCA